MKLRERLCQQGKRLCPCFWTQTEVDPHAAGTPKHAFPGATRRPNSSAMLPHHASTSGTSTSGKAVVPPSGRVEAGDGG